MSQIETITAQELFDDVAQAMGWDAEDIGVRQWRDMRAALGAAMQRIWQDRDVWWPDLMRTEYMPCADRFSVERIAIVGPYQEGDVVYFEDADGYYMAISEVSGEPPATWSESEQEWVDTPTKWVRLQPDYSDATVWAPGVSYPDTDYQTGSIFAHAGRYWVPREIWVDAPSNIGLSPTSHPSYWIELPVFRFEVPRVSYGRAPIGEVRSISRLDPRKYGEPGEYDWEPVGGGRWGVYDAEKSQVWVGYRLACPRIVGSEWDETVAYVAAPIEQQIYGSVMSPLDVPMLQVATPVMSPQGGAFVGTMVVTLSCATTGAAIMYTTNGADPTATAGTLYTGPITVSDTVTIKAAAFRDGMLGSAIVTGTFARQLVAYWGSSVEAVLDEDGILALSGITATSPGRTYTITAPGVPGKYVFLAWPDSWSSQPVEGTGFATDGFPAAMAGPAEGFEEEENGWNYALVTVGGIAYRLYRLYYAVEIELEVTVTAS